MGNDLPVSMKDCKISVSVNFFSPPSWTEHFPLTPTPLQMETVNLSLRKEMSIEQEPRLGAEQRKDLSVCLLVS